MNLTRQHVLEARWELARRHLIDFARQTMPGYEPARHHHQIAELLEAVERGELNRLAIFMPPRHGKSELVSRRFPAWVLGRDPAHQIIASSYGHDLATDFGREVREIVNDQDYRSIFPEVSLKPDDRAANRWKTNHGGAYYAVGVTTSATGRGADTFLIDDPFKDREEADSEGRRDKVWNWYRSVAYTRLSPVNRVILVNTRWHDDDLSGRVLEQMQDGGDKWEVLSLPAIDEGGRALWPARFPVERLQAIQKTIGPREWSALYQQQPQPDEGTYFRREWFKRWRTRPANLHVYMTSDHATKEDAGDFTVFRVWGVDHLGDLYLLDGFKAQTTTDKWMERGVELIKRHKPLCWFPENDQAWRAVAPFVQRFMYTKGVNCRREPLPTSGGDKPTKARGFQAMASMGRVYLPDTPEGDEILNEYLRFPAGKHDDEVDAAANMGRALDEAHPAIVKVQSRPTGPVDSYTRARPSSGEDNDWMVA